MGFNISGVVASKNLQNELSVLENELGYKLVLEGEVDFETASLNWKDDDICDIYYGKFGTIVFLSYEHCMEGYSIDRLNTLTFAYSETSMTFCFSYFANGEFRRSIMEADGAIVSSQGKSIDIEFTPIETSDLIWHLIDSTLGEGYGSIDLGAKAYRYRMVKEVSISPKQEVTHNSTSKDVNKVIRNVKFAYKLYVVAKWVGLAGSACILFSLLINYYNLFGIVLVVLALITRSVTHIYLKKMMPKS